MRRCSVRAMYLSTSAMAGKPNRGAITSVRPLPLPLRSVGTRTLVVECLCAGIYSV